MKRTLKNKKSKTMTVKDRILSKFTTGRSKAHKKRKNTLLLEYKLKDKANKFVDRRIGEKHRGMTAEDKQMARFTAQRIKSHKKMLFNLGSEDSFTHKGRSLGDLEKFDDPRSESDNEESGKLDADFVSKAHFGGGIFSKKGDNGGNVLDKMIIESKKKKAERQKDRDEAVILTEKLDENLKNLMDVVSARDKNQQYIPKQDSYDIAIRELKFERVGRPSDKTKSQEEIANEENLIKQKLEEERLKRMKRQAVDLDNKEKPPIKKMRSADDLDDGFGLDIYDEKDEDDGDKEDGSDFLIDNHQSKNFVHADIYRELSCNSGSVDDKIALLRGTLDEKRKHTGISNKQAMEEMLSGIWKFSENEFKNESDEAWPFLDKVAPILFELTQICGDKAAEIFQNILREKSVQFQRGKKYAILTLALLKIIPLLFPTSDFYHAVATPAGTLLSRILSRCSKCDMGQDFGVGLFCTTLTSEYIHLSGRYHSEAINFLRRCWKVVCKTSNGKTVPKRGFSFRLSKNRSNTTNAAESNFKMSVKMLKGMAATDKNKIKIMATLLKTTRNFAKLYGNFPCTPLIWKPISDLLQEANLTNYPNTLEKEFGAVRGEVKAFCEKPLEGICKQKKRPKALRLYEPNIRQVIEGRSFKTVSREKMERDKLTRRYKQEMKGAMREIRKDRTFLARVKISEQDKRDEERREKVKKILGWGQEQQSEFKRMERQNRYRH